MVPVQGKKKKRERDLVKPKGKVPSGSRDGKSPEKKKI